MAEVTRIPEYSTVKFTDIWDKEDDFEVDFENSPMANSISIPNVTLLYYLLYARYGNNPIANWDTNQWKYKIFSIIFQYGPTWEKRLEIQQKLRGLSDDDLLVGSKAIYNHAYNPSVSPSTSSLTELDYINDQNTTNFKRSKLDAYTILLELLETDVTEEFISKFKVCFKQFVRPERPTLFVTEIDDEEV